jgi:hypothetical protein
LSQVDEALVPNGIAREKQVASWNEVLGNVLKATGGKVVGSTEPLPASTSTYGSTPAPLKKQKLNQ